MFDFLDRLREKPEAYRLRVTVITAVVVTGVIVLGWLLTLGVFQTEDAVRADASQEQSDAYSPFRTIWGGLSEAFGNSKAQWKELRGALEQAPAE